jgi:hypothetical protein
MIPLLYTDGKSSILPKPFNVYVLMKRYTSVPDWIVTHFGFGGGAAIVILLINIIKLKTIAKINNFSWPPPFVW